MVQIKQLFKSSRFRTTLGVIVIAIAVAWAFTQPNREADPDIGISMDSVTPTVGVTRLADMLDVNRSTDFQHVQITVKQVQEAAAFSDDRKKTGVYTVRVLVHAQPDKGVQKAIGLDYSSLVRLVLADGQTVPPKLIDLPPVILPIASSDGYFDFPVSAQVPLSSLAFRLGDNATIPFK